MQRHGETGKEFDWFIVLICMRGTQWQESTDCPGALLLWRLGASVMISALPEQDQVKRMDQPEEPYQPCPVD